MILSPYAIRNTPHSDILKEEKAKTHSKYLGNLRKSYGTFNQ
ncbi:hypothetical protein HMPREF1869_00645 [Bacteroidales bacterium KA00251]|nr:hypothetical protein HMPREF1869_00645 [Bacteroidales bacterium KA00251]